MEEKIRAEIEEMKNNDEIIIEVNIIMQKKILCSLFRMCIVSLVAKSAIIAWHVE